MNAEHFAWIAQRAAVEKSFRGGKFSSLVRRQ
jgi:hypothetical protein